MIWANKLISITFLSFFFNTPFGLSKEYVSKNHAYCMSARREMSIAVFVSVYLNGD